MHITIYHNPRCGKSRTACKLMDTKGKAATIVEYLKNPLSEAELKVLLTKLDKKPIEIIRKTEAIYKATYRGKQLNDAEWIAALVEHPILMQRPIVVVDDAAWVVRDEDAVDDMLDAIA